MAEVPKLQLQSCLGPESQSKEIQSTSDFPQDKTKNPTKLCINYGTTVLLIYSPFSYSCFGLAKILSSAENKNCMNLQIQCFPQHALNTKRERLLVWNTTFNLRYSPHMGKKWDLISWPSTLTAAGSWSENPVRSISAFKDLWAFIVCALIDLPLTILGRRLSALLP